MTTKDDKKKSKEQDSKTPSGTGSLDNGGHNDPPTGGLTKQTDSTPPSK